MNVATPPDERRAWLAIAWLGMATLAGLHAAGFAVRWQSALPPMSGALALHVISRFYRSVRLEPRLAATCAALAQLVAFTMIAGPLSYLAAALDRPLQDARLMQADLSVGFDWRACLAFVDARAGLHGVMRLAYDTLMPQLAAAILVLGLSGRLRELRVLVWAAGLSGGVAILVSALLPAAGYYVHLGLRPADFPHIDPSAAFVHMTDFTGLRDGGDRLIDLSTLQGIITFPSFHAALATLFAWAFWQHPAARWPGCAFEAIVIAATPIDGGHYLVDVLAGVLVAAASIAAARRWLAQAPDTNGVTAGIAATGRLRPAATLRSSPSRH